MDQKTSRSKKKIEKYLNKKDKDNQAKNKRMNTEMKVEMMNQSDMITRGVINLIKKAQREVLEVCAKEYNFDINAAMLLLGGSERK